MAYMTTWVRATIAAATVGCCGVMTAATTAANPPDFDLSHHPAPALAPGVGLGIYNADGNPVDTCTAGWIVHDSTGQAACSPPDIATMAAAPRTSTRPQVFKLLGGSPIRLMTATTARTPTSPRSVLN